MNNLPFLSHGDCDDCKKSDVLVKAVIDEFLWCKICWLKYRDAAGLTEEFEGECN